MASHSCLTPPTHGQVAFLFLLLLLPAKKQRQFRGIGDILRAMITALSLAHVFSQGTFLDLSEGSPKEAAFGGSLSQDHPHGVFAGVQHVKPSLRIGYM